MYDSSDSEKMYAWQCFNNGSDDLKKLFGRQIDVVSGKIIWKSHSKAKDQVYVFKNTPVFEYDSLEARTTPECRCKK
jgi:hypothetical protein